VIEKVVVQVEVDVFRDEELRRSAGPETVRLVTDCNDQPDHGAMKFENFDRHCRQFVLSDGKLSLPF